MFLTVNVTSDADQEPELLQTTVLEAADRRAYEAEFLQARRQAEKGQGRAHFLEHRGSQYERMEVVAPHRAIHHVQRPRQRKPHLDDRVEALGPRTREVVEARTAAEERKRAAEEWAAQRTAAAKKQADDVAVQRTKSAEAAKRDEQARIRANEQKVAAAAKAKLGHAQARRTKADIKRVQADRVEELAGIEKQKRQSERCE